MPLPVFRAVLTTFGCLCLLAGCGSGGERGSVSGTVTLDGKTLDGGSISFVPIEGTQSSSSGATIAAGSYDIPRDKGPMPGVYRIVVHSPRKTGKRIPVGSPAPPGTLVDETVEAVPAKYNDKSDLRHVIKSGGNKIDFALVSP